MSDTLRDKAKERDGYECQKCGRDGNSTNLHAHHIHPSYAGGEDKLENLVTLCSHCHRFAPEAEDNEVAQKKTDEYLSTDLRPELDLFLFGMEYGSRVYGEQDTILAADQGEKIVSLFERLESDEGTRPPKRPEKMYNILFSSWKGSRVTDGDDIYWGDEVKRAEVDSG